MFCSNCGKEIDNNSQFCPFCGFKAEQPANQNPPVTEKPTPEQDPPTFYSQENISSGQNVYTQEANFQTQTPYPNEQNFQPQQGFQPEGNYPPQQSFQPEGNFQAQQGFQPQQNYPNPPMYQPSYPPEVAPKKKSYVPLVLGLCGGLVLVVLLVVAGFLFVRSNNYKQAIQSMDKGEYQVALDKFTKLKNYKSSVSLAEECQNELKYQDAISKKEAGEYDISRELFVQLNDFHESKSYINEIDYIVGMQYFSEENYEQALEKLEPLGEYEDAKRFTQLSKDAINYKKAQEAMTAKEYQSARDLLSALSSPYQDSDQLLLDCENYILYEAALSQYDNGEFYAAFNAFKKLGEFEDSPKKALDCIRSENSGELYRNPAYEGGTSVFIAIGHYDNEKDSFIKLYTKSGEYVLGVYVKAGKTVRVNIPIGEYEFRIAYGSSWFGEKNLFGEDGYYEIFEEDGKSIWVFEKGEEGGWSLTVANMPTAGSEELTYDTF